MKLLEEKKGILTVNNKKETKEDIINGNESYASYLKDNVKIARLISIRICSTASAHLYSLIVIYPCKWQRTRESNTYRN
jgi:hypothetical protein